MVMTSDETQIQMCADWSKSHAKRVTIGNRKIRQKITSQCRDNKIADRQLLSSRKYVAKTMLKMNILGLSFIFLLPRLLADDDHDDVEATFGSPSKKKEQESPVCTRVLLFELDLRCLFFSGLYQAI